MKLSVKTLKGQHFEVQVDPSEKVSEAKSKIEAAQGRDTFPKEQLLLIYQGKVLKDDTTLEDNKVSESGFVVVMLTKAKPVSTPAASTAASAAAPSVAATPAAAPQPAAPTAAVPEPTPAAPAPPVPSAAEPTPMDIAAAPPSSTPPAPAEPAPAPAPAAAAAATAGPVDLYGQAASTLVAGSHLESVVQQLIDMGGGAWDRDTVIRALRAAYNNPERAVDYLYSGIPETAEPAPPVARAPPAQPTAAAAAPTSAAPAADPLAAAAAAAAPPPAAAAAAAGGPNVAPLNLFPQNVGGAGAGAAGALDFLRENPQFQRMRAMLQANPQMLPALLQGLEKQNPELAQLIASHQMEFIQLLSEGPGEEGDVLGDLGAGIAAPQAIQVTEEERAAIERLEALGFERAAVIEAFFACDKDEQLAANYLLENGDFDD